MAGEPNIVDWSALGPPVAANFPPYLLDNITVKTLEEFEGKAALYEAAFILGATL